MILIACPLMEQMESLIQRNAAKKKMYKTYRRQNLDHMTLKVMFRTEKIRTSKQQAESRNMFFIT